MLGVLCNSSPFNVNAWHACLMASLLVISMIGTSAAANEDFGYSDYYGQLTPTQVYEVVYDLNALVSYFAEQHHPQLAATMPDDMISVAGYQPEQVFLALSELSDQLDQFSIRYDLAPMRRVARQQDVAIPAEVYLQAGICLDAFVLNLAKIEPMNAFGSFYNLPTDGLSKTPSDVFALVELVNRKLTLLLAVMSADDE
ncbi:hypothetical protein [Shewanella sp. NIFS-20-20]|uniref:hypothetical protein n=1 Tax=Shewanella sp. NIFS-20-20 TaxID=2853806 RepID=UPI001C477A13|nr:hypothetical protein [Shewanella sp. NIFS-20-20]MBV7315101.1 hypothetical protein [Shewanella sp. NIFS-20-20]